MGSTEITMRSAEIERELLRPVGQMWAALHKKFDACPQRENGAPHAPEFGANVNEIRCAHCDVDLLAI
jgi:hypothetical protein